MLSAVSLGFGREIFELTIAAHGQEVVVEILNTSDRPLQDDQVGLFADLLLQRAVVRGPEHIARFNKVGVVSSNYLIEASKANKAVARLYKNLGLLVFAQSGILLDEAKVGGVPLLQRYGQHEWGHAFHYGFENPRSRSMYQGYGWLNDYDNGTGLYASEPARRLGWSSYMNTYFDEYVADIDSMLFCNPDKLIERIEKMKQKSNREAAGAIINFALHGVPSVDNFVMPVEKYDGSVTVRELPQDEREHRLSLIT